MLVRPAMRYRIESGFGPPQYNAPGFGLPTGWGRTSEKISALPLPDFVFGWKPHNYFGREDSQILFLTSGI